MKDKIVKNYCTKIRENGKNWNDEKCKGQKELQVITYLEYLKYPFYCQKYNAKYSKNILCSIKNLHNALSYLVQKSNISLENIELFYQNQNSSKTKKKKKKKKKTNITFLKSNIIHSTNFPFDRREMFHFPSYSSCTESKVATIKIQGNKSLNGGFWEAVDITNTKKKMVKQREKRKRGAK